MSHGAFEIFIISRLYHTELCKVQSLCHQADSNASNKLEDLVIKIMVIQHKKVFFSGAFSLYSYYFLLMSTGNSPGPSPMDVKQSKNQFYDAPYVEVKNKLYKLEVKDVCLKPNNLLPYKL